MTAIRGAAAITGAASGIGRALAIEFCRRGCDVALADRDEAGLKTLAAEIGGSRKVSVHRIDVGEAEDVARFATEAVAAHPALNILVNNAGVALLGSFEEIDQAQMEWLFDIDFWGVVHGTRGRTPQCAIAHKAGDDIESMGRARHKLVIASAANQSRNASAERLWIASLR